MPICTMLIVFKGVGTPDAVAPDFVASEARGTVLEVSGDEVQRPDDLITRAPGQALMSTRVFNRDGRFWEAGRISFPDIDSYLDVASIDAARSYPRADGSSYGAATWRIVAGRGRFAGAEGLVTGNFTGDAASGFVDHQYYKIFLPA